MWSDSVASPPARPEVAAAPPATHGGPSGRADERTAVRHDFSTSVNAYGPASSVHAAVRAACTAESLERYPDPECLAPCRAAAAAYERPIGEVIIGAGAAELLHAACFTFVRAGDAVVVPSPAFGEYARAAALCGGQVSRAASVALSAPSADAADALRQAILTVRPRLAFACTPENPTGRAWSLDDVNSVADACAQVGALLMLDQSYDAFAPAPLGTPALPGHPAVLHLRSLTKDHALAGIRAAVAIGPACVVDALQRARVPWAVSAGAQAAIVAVFGPEAQAHAARTTALLRDAARGLADACAAAELAPHPSDTHYFLAEVPPHLGDAPGLRARLLARGGLNVRDCTSFGLPRAVRIAARTPNENAALVRALTALDPTFPTIESMP
jgi:histidinol-phosphate/aromatic aminotransferase/cobyric acid decarboxylase-like protein